MTKTSIIGALLLVAVVGNLVLQLPTASVSVTSRSENWRADNLIDGFPFQMGGGGGCVVCGWTTRDGTFPHEVVFALAQDREFTIDALVVDPSTDVHIVAARQTAIELKKEGREVGIKVKQP